MPTESSKDTAPPKPPRPPRRLGPLDTGRSTPLPSWGGILARCAVAALALVATLALLHRLAAPGGGDLIASKRQVYERRADRVDTLLLGSSHVYRGIDPARLDTALADGGLPSTAFNYGIQLPNLIELRFVLREALEQGHGKLRRVVLEYMRLVPQVDPQNAFVPRSIYWHDREQAFLAAERVRHWAEELGGDFPYVERTQPGRDGELVLRHANSTTGVLDRSLPVSMRARRDHLLHWLANLALVGRHEDLARGVLGRDHSLVSWVAPGSGYVSLEAEEARLEQFGVRNNPYAERNALFLSDPDAYLARVERLRTEEVVFGDEEWMNSALLQVDDLDVLRAMRDDCRAADVDLVVVVMPANSTDRRLEARLGRELDVPVLIYTDPDAHPELFDPSLRYDSGHFDEAGAQVFTDVLAQDLLRLVEEGRLQ